ncbi:MAG: CBS domain-containing protein [Ignavibacteria bacterium]|jgi:CBS domain-containing protein|nr:CBS domain-containing protein [Ignavibacteria bacterium]MDH7528676.1 CBS domain-containing protein [Ignavibacteria bacterium]
MKTLKEIISDRPILSVQKDFTIRQVSEYMAQNKIGLVPILDGDKLVGVFSERDLLQRVVAAGKDPDKTKVEEVMTINLIISDEDETYLECLSKMKTANIRHIIVKSGDKLKGVVSMRDLLQADLNIKDETIETLYNYINSKPILKMSEP